MSSARPTPIEGGKGSIGLRPDGILHLRWTPGTAISGDDARAAMREVNNLCGEVSHPMLVDMEAIGSVSRDARSTFSIPCAASRIALLGKSPVDRLIANFFLGLHTPPCPTNFFTSRTDAIRWLSEGLSTREGTG